MSERMSIMFVVTITTTAGLLFEAMTLQSAQTFHVSDC